VGESPGVARCGWRPQLVGRMAARVFSACRVYSAAVCFQRTVAKQVPSGGMGVFALSAFEVGDELIRDKRLMT